MKKLILIFILFSGVLLVAGTVSAEESNTGAVRPLPAVKQKILDVKERVLEKKEVREASTAAKKQEVLKRVRRAAHARWEVHKKAITLAENLLNKLQNRIDKAEAAGKDISEMAELMADAREKLSDAKSKLEEVKSKKDTAIDRVTFRNVQKNFQEIRRDLHAIRVNAGKIIRILKGFNSATSSGKNPQASTAASVSE